MSVRYLNRIDDLDHLTDAEKDRIRAVTKTYPFLANDYYLSLIDWDDPADPIRRIVIPDVAELSGEGTLDASREIEYTVMPGLQHKYDTTALLLVSGQCGGICRYCFRKRIFMGERFEVLQDVPAAMQYIRDHREITNVLVTGGDPFRLETADLEGVIRQLREIDHVQIIRIGTKMLTYDPSRILDDPSLVGLIQRYSWSRKRIYIMTHFTHPRELTEPAMRAVVLLIKAGALLANQIPLIRGVNDEPGILGNLFQRLAFAGIPSYYLFQCRPAFGNATYIVPLEEGYEILERAKSKVSGLAKRARYVMSHATGKVEIVGLTESQVYFKYHRTPQDEGSGRFLVYERNPKARWLDDYTNLVDQHDVVP